MKFLNIFKCLDEIFPSTASDDDEVSKVYLDLLCLFFPTLVTLTLNH